MAFDGYYSTAEVVVALQRAGVTARDGSPIGYDTVMSWTRPTRGGKPPRIQRPTKRDGSGSKAALLWSGAEMQAAIDFATTCPRCGRRGAK